MSYYDIERLVKDNAERGLIIAPNDYDGWVRYCIALIVLDYDESLFVAVSEDPAAARQKWRANKKAKHKLRMTPNSAEGTIVKLSQQVNPNCRAFLWRLNPDRAPRPTPPPRPTAPTTPKQPPIYVDPPFIQDLQKDTEQTALYNFLCSLFPSEDVRRVFERYKVGGAKYIFFDYDSDTEPTLPSAFPYINAAGQCVDIHLQPYDNRGHRAKKSEGQPLQNWILHVFGQSDRRGDWCLFGEHLINDDPTAPIAIVESEKTAIIAAIAWRRYGYIWVATGGLHKLTLGLCAALKGRQLYLFPDVDGVEKWTQRWEELTAAGYNVTLCSDYVIANAEGEKDDIGDIIINHNEQQQKAK